tara:strand:+ start:947 stop:1348 length:402 start_codon:yes stop_codon:yes gene_type:complete
MTINHYWIVDDDPIARVLIRKKMSNEGLCEKFSEFQNGQEALEALKGAKENETPDLIFLDLNMPIMDGWEFLEEAHHKLENVHARVAILTSSISPDDWDRSQNIPSVSCFLNKPLNTAELLNRIDSNSRPNSN